MDVQISRETFLRALESVQAGLSPRETIEQSTCFCFDQGEVITYNDEASCRGPSGLPRDFRAAVASQDLLEILRKLDDEAVRVTDEKDQFWIKSKRRKAWHNMEAEIRLPYSGVDTPTEFKPLPEDFTEAVNLVKSCTGKDVSRFQLTCINLAPKWVEACDDFQACRWRMDLDLKSSVLVKCSAIEAVTTLGSHEFCETDNWIHFRNSRGFILSCRRYTDEFPSRQVGRLFEYDGVPVTLPKGLTDAVEKANIYSQHTAETNLVEIRLCENKMSVEGRGNTGGYREVRNVEWKGDDVTFLIPPQLLTELVKKYNEVKINPEILKIDGGVYTYATSLLVPKSNTVEDSPKPSKKKKEKVSSDQGD